MRTPWRGLSSKKAPVLVSGRTRGRTALTAVGAASFYVVPVIARQRTLGLVVADNAHSGAPLIADRLRLLSTFAMHVATAVDNARLLGEVGERDRLLTEALAQQMAITNTLQAISRCSTEARPVLDIIAESAASFCSAEDAIVLLVEGDFLRVVSHCGIIEKTTVGQVLELRRELASGQAVLERCVVHVPDVLRDVQHPDSRMHGQQVGYRSGVAAPLLRDGRAIGAIALRRAEPRPFSDKQVQLLGTFADQAVIAIENTRLFHELQERLEQQTATSQILRVISQSQRDVLPVFETIGDIAVKLCRGISGGVFTFDGELIHLATGPGLSPEAIATARQTYPMPPGRGGATARAILSKAVAYVPDVLEDEEFRIHSAVRASNHRCVVSVPMLRGGKPIGAITVGGPEPRMFSERQIAMLRTFADQAVIAIENTRLFNELESRNRDLTESLEQQTATSEILRVISSSPTDLEPVLHAVAENAARLCGASDANIFRVDGDHIRLAVAYGSVSSISTDERMRIRRDLTTGRAVIDRCVVHIPDLLAESDTEFGEAKEYARRLGYRTILVVPMLREGAPIGGIAIRHTEVRPFSEKQIALLQTFADQAVIAIENTRLFNELKSRNRDLTESLEQQTATSEILRVISESQRDVQPVFKAIAASARKLCEATMGVVHTFDGELINLAASDRVSRSAPEALHRAYPIPPSRVGVIGRAILTRAVEYVPDIREDPEYRLQSLAEVSGYRSALSARPGHRHRAGLCDDRRDRLRRALGLRRDRLGH